MNDAGGKTADQSALEIKTALRKLNPKNGGDHKYRVRRFNKFRNYVTDGGGEGDKPVMNTPEFYDDDLHTLFVGVTMNGEDLGYSLLKAAGEPSSDHNGTLKRSAKNAMALIKFLVCDFVDMENGNPINPEGELNGFAQAFCSLTTQHLTQCKLELHLLDHPGDSQRSGSKEDACEIILMLILHHTDETGANDEPMNLDKLLPNPQAREVFENYIHSNKSVKIFEKMRNRVSVARELAKSNPAADDESQYPANDSIPNINKQKSTMSVFTTNTFVSAGSGSNNKNSSQLTLNLNTGPPTTWIGAQLQRNFGNKQQTGSNPLFQSSSHARSSLRMSLKAVELEGLSDDADEIDYAIEERSRNNRKDPLELRVGMDFDLQMVQAKRDALVQQTLEFFQEHEEELMRKMKMSVSASNTGSMLTNLGGKEEEKEHAIPIDIQEQLLTTMAKRESFMTMIEKSAQIHQEKKQKDPESEEMEQTHVDITSAHSIASILPIDPDFDPLLFLSLVHGDANYFQLQDALSRLNTTADNQVIRLQNIVRKNFALFVRCADGFDAFAYDDDNDSTPGTRALAPEQLDKLDNLADSCSSQAKKSFKPLLDNTNEVRKTQRAIALLHRVSPLLQVSHQMRQHMEAGNFNAAIKAYRRILVIDEDCKIDLLRCVKTKADDAARDARIIIEKTLGDASVPVNTLLQAITDLGELEELHLVNRDDMNGNSGQAPVSGKKKKKKPTEDELQQQKILRQNPPALACLLLQANHFSNIVEHFIEYSDEVVTRIYNGDSSVLQEEFRPIGTNTEKSDMDFSVVSDFSSNTSDSRRKTKWRYDILEARVKLAIYGVVIARKWLSRLLRIGIAAVDAERRNATRMLQKNTAKSTRKLYDEDVINKPLEIFTAQVSPAIDFLVSHVNFCSLGCSNTNESDVRMTFGHDCKETLQILLRTPLPPHESSRCATELAALVEIVRECADTANDLKPTFDSGDSKVDDGPNLFASPAVKRRSLGMIIMDDPLRNCVSKVERAVGIIERRRCIYAFHVCTRNCGRRASGSGIFDGNALFECVETLGKELSRPEECYNELVKGCKLVTLKCCEGLVEYVKDKGGGARLRAVSECANMLAHGIKNVVREVSELTNGSCETLIEIIENEIMGLESNLFEDFLEEVRRDVTSCVKLGFLDLEDSEDDVENDEDVFDQKLRNKRRNFPGYLSASLLAIVRCRAKVEKALGNSTIRRSQNETYLHIAMSTASDSLLDELCASINERATRMSKKQAERMANELQFLVNTLHKDLSEDMMQTAESCRRMLCGKSGTGGSIRGDGPDGLAAIEELERLGRVYVMCLGMDDF